jgi:hypothetical protein
MLIKHKWTEFVLVQMLITKHIGSTKWLHDVLWSQRWARVSYVPETDGIYEAHERIRERQDHRWCHEAQHSFGLFELPAPGVDMRRLPSAAATDM